MKVGPYTIRVLGEKGGVRDVRPDEEPAIREQMRLVGEAAEAGERLDALDFHEIEESQRKRLPHKRD